MRTSVLIGLAGAVWIAMSGAAEAHSFNALLILPLSGPAAGAGEQARDGFMLATTERDSHPDEESDGHLGGLDVYVSVEDVGDRSAGRPRPANGEGFEFVVVLDPTGDLAGEKWPSTPKPVVVRPRPIPIQNPPEAWRSAVAAFTEAFMRAYGRTPSEAAARGYDAARRIDAVIRQAGGVADPVELQRSLEALSDDVVW